MTPLSTVRALRRAIARPPDDIPHGDRPERSGAVGPGPTSAAAEAPATGRSTPHAGASVPPARPVCDGIGPLGVTERPRHLSESCARPAADSVAGRGGRC